MTIVDPATAPARELKMDFAGSLVKHLGLQMYSGAVPAIAELIANAYDADATRVDVEVPLDTQLVDTSEIVIRDNGSGMTFDQLNQKYLIVGRDRRLSGEDRSPIHKRRVLGRKGLGKLAGFGVAKLVTITTVRDGWLTRFEMKYDAILGSNTQPYHPTVLDDRALRDDEDATDGTEIRLSELQLKNRISGEAFLRSMGRRFSILGGTFEVKINGAVLEQDSTDLQFRYPEKGVDTAEVGGIGTVTWWVGFTEKPIKNDDIRGVSVLSRGKLVQTPFLFELTGGVQNQLGLQYITGQVFADGLDEYGDDLIATDRATVLWEHPIAQPLLEWGQKMLRDSLAKWATARAGEQKKRLRDSTPYMERIEKFPPRQQQELIRAIDTLANSSTIEDHRLDEIVKILLNAYENEQFFAVLKELSSLSEEDAASLFDLMHEWDILEAVQTAQQIRGRVTVIRTLRRLIKAGAPEKPTMQDLLRDYPWLIDPTWELFVHERSLETVLRDAFHSDVKEDDQRRLDFLCIGDASTAIVVEVKRPGEAAGLKELRQLQDYVNTLKERNEQTSNSPTKRTRIEGVMIYDHLTNAPGVKGLRDDLMAQGYRIQPWDHLLEAAERSHRDFLDVIKERAPEDPRIEAIDQLDLDDESLGDVPEAEATAGIADTVDSEPSASDPASTASSAQPVAAAPSTARVLPAPAPRRLP